MVRTHRINKLEKQRSYVPMTFALYHQLLRQRFYLYRRSTKKSEKRSHEIQREVTVKQGEAPTNKRYRQRKRRLHVESRWNRRVHAHENKEPPNTSRDTRKYRESYAEAAKLTGRKTQTQARARCWVQRRVIQALLHDHQDFPSHKETGCTCASKEQVCDTKPPQRTNTQPTHSPASIGCPSSCFHASF